MINERKIKSFFIFYFLVLFCVSCSSVRKNQSKDVQKLKTAILRKDYLRARDIVNKKFKEDGIAYKGDGLTRRSYLATDILKLISLHEKCFKDLEICNQLRKENWRSFLYGQEEISLVYPVEKDIEKAVSEYESSKIAKYKQKRKQERESLRLKREKENNDRELFLKTKEGALSESCEWNRQLQVYFESLVEQKRIEKISGVVDLKKKRSLGEGIRFRQSMLKNWSKKYKSRSGKSWDSSLCR